MWELDHKEDWALKNWCFWTVVLYKTHESPLDREGIKPVNPKENKIRIFIGRTDVEAEAPIFWPPDVKSQAIRKHPDTGKDWRQEERGTIEGEMVEWHHWVNGHEFETSSRRWWRTCKPNVLQSMVLQESGMTELFNKRACQSVQKQYNSYLSKPRLPYLLQAKMPQLKSPVVPRLFSNISENVSSL